MSSGGPYSLRQRLFWRLLGVQSVVLLMVVAVLFGSGQLASLRSTDATIEMLRDAVIRQPSGALSLEATPALEALRKQEPDLWFLIRDTRGQRLSEGRIPEEYARIGTALDQIGQARLGWNIGDPDRPTARMRWAETSAGRLQFITGTEVFASPLLVMMGASLVLAKLVAPIVLVMAVGALIATPLVVRKSLAGVDRAAKQADAIDAIERGGRLSTDDIPGEVTPLVKAVNRALDRLDEGFERQERFLADAAHELRTPVAILSTRIGALPDGAARSQLLEDSERLTILTEQMLDLQRLRQGKVEFETIDIGELASEVGLDMAPIAFAAGYTMQFDNRGSGRTQGDRSSLRRALMNIVQNAVDHGGRRGEIGVIVEANWVEIRDEGPGISAELQERIFEPFFKHHQNGRGAGLGLHLVRDIMRMHGGEVTISNGAKGVICRLMFPKA
ncbi:sensor histidine kinase [Labrys sp. KB_33_2]|uniref:sensor histidine kinase n=1 Tax=Labrys sp. KB_33_2 TaxID=3237479 RepID=UPI003F91A2A7